ncbi:hypothetical protein ACFUC1_18635 [Pedococcus sp. NPDC057267]|uniref:hypothetical protein n=1 Tax=Pedococcus sp. NPDC057267 TaxID=3346077 RepID=UPI00363B75F5
MPQTSRTPRTHTADPTGDGLTHLSVRELLQRLAACEEELRSPLPEDPLSSPASSAGSPAGLAAGARGSGRHVAGRQAPGAGLSMPGQQPPAERQALLREEAAISRELQRRRHLRHPRQHAAERRPSAAWPPPPW